MTICAGCGRESPDDFGFCPACGAPLAAMPTQEVRKVVTVLFCDLTGSTAIGERTDPEALRALMNRYYDAARSVIERHGGTVEKFVGDAVMAVFGIPVSTELDALRAVRSAVELRDVVHELELEARIGLNTGPVVAGEGDTLVTGDAVNVAARLEQAAGAGEILLGDDTLQHVRDAVATAPVELSLKGKTGVVPAHRLLALDAAAAGVARHLERPMVGRERERERLRADFDDVVAGRTCRLFTLIGPAGIGKSRLVADFLEHVDGVATVARGRALSYGEGITYWPLVEMLIQLGVEPSDAIRSSPAETQLATRALLEGRAAEQPLVLVVDDLHWAEPPMLDLVEHVVDWSRSAPILLLCVARPELLDVRPGWAGGKLNATSVLLEPLADSDARELTEALLGDVDLDGETKQRILATAEGNPLFLEEMAALAREAHGTVEVPPTIRALLQARLDTLNDAERTVIQRGAVEGQVFHRSSVTALAPAAPVVDVPQQLLALVRKELVRPDQALIAGDDAFRFRHLLIRDTAYEGLPKAVRAELHELFADWLEARAELVEQDELVGYHLEQAARYRMELDPADPAAAGLAQRAAERLGAAGRAAYQRGDLFSARSALGRAIELVPGSLLRSSLLPDLVDALLEASEWETAAELVDELSRGGEQDRAHATALRVLVEPVSGSELVGALDAAQRVLGEAGDVEGLARCELARALLAWVACRAGDAHRAYRCAYTLLSEAGVASRDRLCTQLLASGVFGGASVSEMQALQDELAGDDAVGPLQNVVLRSARARIAYGAGAGSLDELAEAVAAETELHAQTGAIVEATSSNHYLTVVVPWLAGDTAARELGTRRRVGDLETMGARLYLANALGEWALALSDVGDARAALDAVARGRSLAHEADLADQIILDLAEAHARALLGEADEARRLLGRALERQARIDMVFVVAEPDHTAATVAALLGDVDEARTLLGRLVRCWEARGFHRFADRYRRDLAALESRAPD